MLRKMYGLHLYSDNGAPSDGSYANITYHAAHMLRKRVRANHDALPICMYARTRRRNKQERESQATMSLKLHEHVHRHAPICVIATTSLKCTPCCSKHAQKVCRDSQSGMGAPRRAHRCGQVATGLLRRVHNCSRSCS